MKMPSTPSHSARSAMLVAVQFVSAGGIVLSTRWTDFTPIALAVGCLGLGLWGWAVMTMKISRISIHPDVGEGADLVTHGPFRLIRHPMYAGLALFLLACVLAPFQWWRFLLWITLLVVLYLKACLEERLLVGRFPGYTEYRRRTKRFVPFLV